ncbi:MAG TPA: VCBS repeat-containing protein, partial [Isosphaeraceae bacterium]|nr:VCBS repeat-containing protein [Isosphaeraceae bacterium]
MPASRSEPRTILGRLSLFECHFHPSALPIAIALLLSLHPIVGLAEDPPPSISFVDVTGSAGLLEPLAGLMGHGAAWGDVDADGRLDLFVGGFCDRPDAEYQPAPGPVPSRLLIQTAEGRFKTARQSPLELFGRTSGAVFLDLDNDADLDLYVANNARSRSVRTDGLQRSAQLLQSRLFRNDRGQFSDITASSRACPSDLHSARNIGVLDFDNDGLLDLFVLEDRFVGAGHTPRSVLLRHGSDLTFDAANRAAHLPDDLYG